MPPLLMKIDNEDKTLSNNKSLLSIRGCQYCGGLGHSLFDCKKSAVEKRRKYRDNKSELINDI